MTTTAIAPAEVEDLEAWLNYEIEKPCESVNSRTQEPWHDATAEWLIVWDIPCPHPQKSAFGCTPCKEGWVAFSRRGTIGCLVCRAPARVKLVERIR
jgi:hypothetical protein